MTNVGTDERPLRVAIIGAGPAAFYAADHLLRQEAIVVEVDMYDRLPTPYGLVRHGVAPDHQKIKTVTKAFAATAHNPRFRFFGNVEFGTDLSLDDVKQMYDQVVYATGAQSDRQMGIPGEALAGSHPATEFVAWYNGHPDYRDCTFDLSQERVVIVGVGNVAIDVARILCLSPEELRRTDMPDYAIDALSASKVREVHLVGRRGPAQAAFTNPELKELGELEDADIIVRPAEAELDQLSREEVALAGDRGVQRKVEMIQEYSKRVPAGKLRRLNLRFFLSPVELLAAGDHVTGVRAVHTELVKSETGTLTAQPTDQFETIDAGLVFRSVGYRGVPLPGVPFHERWAVILNRGGRVLDPSSEEPITGEYVSGWIKRGPSGVIGTNKPDSVETATAMLQDVEAGKGTFNPSCPSASAPVETLRTRGISYFSFDDWEKLDKMELAAGAANGQPRVKFTSVADMQAALGR